MVNHLENYISIDIETAGPTPGQYSMLSIGACTLREPQATFYIELQPIHVDKISQAMQIGGLDWARLKLEGIPPAEGMTQFADWIEENSSETDPPIFLAFNAVFDWMFINDYFFRYLGHNPFGYKALDIKAYYMGLKGVAWAETGMRFVAAEYLDNQALTHNALQDALDQAQIFRQMLVEANT